ncbi:Golgi apparatus membrane protein TVP38 [Gymnopilus junonius]|uniref:Golgi apparatus membrane protein TVP38 n=1 Tax=Gymnopilus junonius TaxID=109634 RepID=A0A9P5P2W4_GYMJU|nr:Golgi apparatus membrane protein TVP38 [Gymnopilus junonius]
MSCKLTSVAARLYLLQHDRAFPTSILFITFVVKYAQHVLHRYHKLHIFGKLFIWLLVFFYLCLGTFIIVVTPARIFQFLYDKARLLASTRFGWLALGCAIVFASFPPLIGHTTLITLSGFAYGMSGFYIGAAGSVIGSALAFIILRFLFSEKLHVWSGQNEKWQALEAVVRAKGLPLIILIRISPFPPWVYSNSLFASIRAVNLWQFIIATLFVFPKVLLHTFIGSKIAVLSDGKQREHMDSRTKVLNGLLVGGGLVIAIFTSWMVYSLVQRHIRHLDGLPTSVDELAAEAIENYDEEAPLLSPTSPRTS